MVESSIERATQWVVFEPNDHRLWKRVQRTIASFLTLLWRNGALMGTAPGAGLLRQVRRGDQPARGDRRRPAGRRDRSRAGEARGIRHLPHRPDGERRRRRRVTNAGTNTHPDDPRKQATSNKWGAQRHYGRWADPTARRRLETSGGSSVATRKGGARSIAGVRVRRCGRRRSPCRAGDELRNKENNDKWLINATYTAGRSRSTSTATTSAS